MIYLRLELEKDVFATIELGNCYIRINGETCDPNLNMGKEINDMLGSISFTGATTWTNMVFKDGIVDWDHLVCFDDIYNTAFKHDPTEKEHKMKVYIMNDKGNTIESFYVTLVTEHPYKEA